MSAKLAVGLRTCAVHESCPRSPSWLLVTILILAGLTLVALVVWGIGWWRNRARLNRMLGGVPLEAHYEESWEERRP